jgi:hypothetical protein
LKLKKYFITIAVFLGLLSTGTVAKASLLSNCAQALLRAKDNLPWSAARQLEYSVEVKVVRKDNKEVLWTLPSSYFATPQGEMLNGSILLFHAEGGKGPIYLSIEVRPGRAAARTGEVRLKIVEGEGDESQFRAEVTVIDEWPSQFAAPVIEGYFLQIKASWSKRRK